MVSCGEYLDHMNVAAFGFFVYHILSYSIGSIFFYHCTRICGCMFCMLLFNFVNCVILICVCMSVCQNTTELLVAYLIIYINNYMFRP
jgi:hypothetical protein